MHNIDIVWKTISCKFIFSLSTFFVENCQFIAGHGYKFFTLVNFCTISKIYNVNLENSDIGYHSKTFSQKLPKYRKVYKVVEISQEVI